MNYMAGVPVAIALAAAWILLRDKPLALLLPGFALGALVLFFFHLYTFAIYGLLVLCFELGELLRARSARLLARQAVSALHVLPPVVLLVAFSPMTENVSTGRIRLATLSDKAMGLYSIVSIGVVEVALATVFVIGAVVVGGLASRRLVVSPAGLGMVAALTAVFLAMPFTLLGSGFADFRLPIVIAAVAIAATAWRGLPRWAALAVGVAIAAITLLRVGVMTAEWEHANRRYPEIMRVMALMEPGRPMMTLMAQEDASARRQRRPPIDNVSGFAIIVRQAFVPNFFAEPEKQPVSFTPEVLPLAANPGGPVRLYDPADPRLGLEALAGYDYVLLFARTPIRREMPAHLQRVDDGSVPDIALFAVRRLDG